MNDFNEEFLELGKVGAYAVSYLNKEGTPELIVLQKESDVTMKTELIYDYLEACDQVQKQFSADSTSHVVILLKLAGVLDLRPRDLLKGRLSV